MSTIQEMKEDKKKLWQDIQILLNDFQDKHKVEIINIDFCQSYVFGKTHCQLLVRDIEVKL